MDRATLPSAVPPVRSASRARARSTKLPPIVEETRGGSPTSLERDEVEITKRLSWLAKLPTNEERARELSGFALWIAQNPARRYWAKPTVEAFTHLVTDDDLHRSVMSDIATCTLAPHEQYELATEYLRGEKVPNDLHRSSAWMRIAAAHGHNDARFNAARLYLHGVTVEQDITRGCQLLEDAARGGHSGAIAAIGENLIHATYRDSDGFRHLLILYELAHEQHVAAQGLLGRVLAHTRHADVARNPRAAATWTNRAAMNGDAYSQQTLAKRFYDRDASTELGKLRAKEHRADQRALIEKALRGFDGFLGYRLLAHAAQEGDGDAKTALLRIHGLDDAALAPEPSSLDILAAIESE